MRRSPRFLAAAHAGGEDASGVRQGQHVSQPCLAMGRPAAGHRKSPRRGGGLTDAGVSVARLIPNRWLFLEATGQVFRGDTEADLFTSSKPDDLSYVAHLRGYHDLSESTNIDLGVSYSRGHNAAGIVDGTDVGLPASTA